MIVVIADVDEVAALLGLSTERHPTIIRPQTSGLCVHYDPDGSAPEDGDGPDYREDPPLCAYPYPCKDGCPHLDNPEILCPVKDACSAMQEIARMRDACEAEQDTDMTAEETVYETETLEFVEPEPDEDHSYAIQLPTPAKRRDAWTEGENWTVARADTWTEAIKVYRAAYPDSTRTDKAIRSRWEKLHRDCKEPLAPDFVGDAVPVTQCDEAALRRPRFKTEDKVRISHPAFKGYTGTIRRYYAATANYLTHIDGTTDTMWLSEEYLEAL